MDNFFWLFYEIGERLLIQFNNYPPISAKINNYLISLKIFYPFKIDWFWFRISDSDFIDYEYELYDYISQVGNTFK